MMTLHIFGAVVHIRLSVVTIHINRRVFSGFDVCDNIEETHLGPFTTVHDVGETHLRIFTIFFLIEFGLGL